jgi:hypothetical protein
MPQRASVFCNFYIRVDREALVSERALDVGSVAFKAMTTKNVFQNLPKAVQTGGLFCRSPPPNAPSENYLVTIVTHA